jgi:hypothetical protein
MVNRTNLYNAKRDICHLIFESSDKATKLDKEGLFQDVDEILLIKSKLHLNRKIKQMNTIWKGLNLPIVVY